MALLSRKAEILAVGSVLNERFMQDDIALAADEFMIITAAKRYGFIRQLQRKRLEPPANSSRPANAVRKPAGVAGGGEGGGGGAAAKGRGAEGTSAAAEVKQGDIALSSTEQPGAAVNGVAGGVAVRAEGLKPPLAQTADDGPMELASGATGGSGVAATVAAAAQYSVVAAEQGCNVAASMQAVVGMANLDLGEPGAAPEAEQAEAVPAAGAGVQAVPPRPLVTSMPLALVPVAVSPGVLLGGAVAPTPMTIPRQPTAAAVVAAGSAAGVSLATAAPVVAAAAGAALMPAAASSSTVPPSRTATVPTSARAVGGTGGAGSGEELAAALKNAVAALKLQVHLQEDAGGKILCCQISQQVQMAAQALEATEAASCEGQVVALQGLQEGQQQQQQRQQQEVQHFQREQQQQLHMEQHEAALSADSPSVSGGTLPGALTISKAARIPPSCQVSAFQPLSCARGGSPSLLNKQSKRTTPPAAVLNSGKPPLARAAPTSHGVGMRGNTPLVNKQQDEGGIAAVNPQGALEESYWSGKLLDCCPMLALFHPEKNRHPHIWRSWRSVLACEVQPWGRGPVKVSRGGRGWGVARVGCRCSWPVCIFKLLLCVVDCYLILQVLFSGKMG